MLDDARAEAFLVEVADASVTQVETLGVETVEPVHALRECIACGLDDEMEVVVEHAECVESPREAAAGVVDARDDRVSVEVVANDALTVDAAHGDVEEAVLRQEVRAPFARHATTVTAETPVEASAVRIGAVF